MITLFTVFIIVYLLLQIYLIKIPINILKIKNDVNDEDEIEIPENSE